MSTPGNGEFESIPDGTTPSSSATNPIELWPGGLVFYVISSEFSATYAKLITDSLAVIEKMVGSDHLQFFEAKTSSGHVCRKNYINFIKNPKEGCKSMIGLKLSGPTDLYLSETYCKEQYAILHEVLHALGRLHEHVRIDRDKYIHVDYKKVYSPTCDNFKHDGRDPSANKDYDYESIMHYNSCTASCDGSYVIKKAEGGGLIYDNKNLSRLDVLKLQDMYKAANKVPYDASRLCREPNHEEEPILVKRTETQSGTETAKTKTGNKAGGKSGDSSESKGGDMATDSAAREARLSLLTGLTGLGLVAWALAW